MSSRSELWRAGLGAVMRDWPALAVAGAMGASLGVALIGLLAPAFGYLPALGGNEFGLAAFARFFATAGIFRSLGLSLWVGLSATFLAFLLTHAVLARFFASRWFPAFAGQSRLLLAAPHVALALAIAFLFAPSGLFARWLSPWLTGWTRPPDYLFPNDPFGLALILGLTAKEFPFLLSMAVAVLAQIRPGDKLNAAASLGYGRVRAFILVVSPLLARRMRFPVLVALAYSIASVDQALILGSNAAPVLPVRLVQWFNDPDLGARFPLAAGAVVLIVLVAAGIGLWRVGGRIVARVIGYGAASGRRAGPVDMVFTALAFLGAAVLPIAVLGLFFLGLNAFSVAWTFPADWPRGLSLSIFVAALGGVLPTMTTTFGLAAISASASVLLALLALEASASAPRLRRALSVLMFAPLIVPEASLLFGLNGFWSALRLDGQAPTVLWAHMLYTLPYAWLLLAGPFRGLDPGLAMSARVLGLGPWAAFWRVKAPALAAPILAAFGVAALVSASLYLPTLIAGGGRVSTLATEAIALAQSGDRRVLGALSLAMLVLPLGAVEGAALAPKILFRRRAGLRGGLA